MRKISISILFLLGLSLSCFLPPSLSYSQVTFPNANQTADVQNNVAGCNSNVPVALCQGGSTSNTASTVAIASGVVTITLVTPMSVAFTSGTYGCLSGATNVNQLNGLLIKFNGSTTTSTLVGTLVNTQNVVQTPANLSATAETNLYVQGPGWQPCYLAPFPAPNTFGCGAQGNGGPGCSASGTPVGVNSWVMGDWAIANPLGGPPALPIVMLTDTNTKNAHSLVPSKNGETNDRNPSLSDGGSPPGYFYWYVQGGNLAVTHGHIDSSACGANPCFINDSTASQVLSQYDCTFGRSTAIQATLGVNHAYIYCDTWVNQYDPVFDRCLLTYNPGTPGTVSWSCTQLYDLQTCPGWGYQSLGPGVDGNGPANAQSTTQFGIDNTDTFFTFGIGGGTQGTLNRHMDFRIKLGSPAQCAVWDSAGMSGTNLYEVSVSSSNQGSGFLVGDTVTFNQGGGNCQSTVTVENTGGGGKITAFITANSTITSNITTVGSAVNFTVASDAQMYVGQTLYVDSGSKLDNIIVLSCGTSTPGASCTSTTLNAIFAKTHNSGVTIEAQSINNSGCSLAQNITPTSTSGSGTGLKVDVTGIGNPTSGTIWPYHNPCTIGSTITCESAIVPIVDVPNNAGAAPFGQHSGNSEASGRYAYTSGYGTTWQAGNGVSAGSWDTVNNTFFGGSNASFSGHPSIGYLFDGAASYPNYYILRWPDGPNCASPPPNLPQCSRIFVFPGGCTGNPGALDNHSHWNTSDNAHGYPVDISSTPNVGFSMTDPPGWTCGYANEWFAVKSDASGITYRFTHWYQNYNNTTENFEASSNICVFAPDGKFAICPMDMYSGFAGNTGLGTSSDSSAPFFGLFSIMTGIQGTPASNVAHTITGNWTLTGTAVIQ